MGVSEEPYLVMEEDTVARPKHKTANAQLCSFI